MSEHAVTEIPLAAPDGFRVIQREVQDGTNIVQHVVSISTTLTVANSAEGVEETDFSDAAVRYAVRALARRVIEQCNEVLR